MTRRAGAGAAMARARPFILPSLGLLLFVAAGWAIHRELAQWTVHDLRAAWRDLPWTLLAGSLAATALGYAVLAFYDVLALRFVRSSLRVGRGLLAGFVGYAFSHAVGLPLLTGGAVRYRLYTAWGLTAGDIASIVAFNGVSLWVGVAGAVTLAGLAFPGEFGALAGIGPLPARLVAVLLALLLAAYSALSLLVGPVIVVGRWRVTLPRPLVCLAQIAVATADWLLAAAALWLLLPGGTGTGLVAFAGLFALAHLAGAVSSVPAGLGVFEAIVLLALPASAHEPAVATALIAYRVMYYVLPLLAAAIIFSGYELAQARRAVISRLGEAQRWADLVVPNLIAGLVFIGGTMLLVSGATPVHGSRMAWLAPLVPVALIEVSHFLGSIAGVALLLLALGLRRRLDAAWLATVVLLGTGAAVSLAKGLDWEEALYLGTVLLVMLPCRRAFYRRSTLTAQRFAPGWLAGVAAVVVGTTWLGFFSYRHVEYSNDLWWQFLAQADAPRFMRATAGVVLLLVLVGAFQLLRFGRPAAGPRTPRPEEIARARAVIAGGREIATNAWLALLGDKRFLFSETGRSFLMYGVQGRSWVALGGPVGAAEERLELLWRFRERCDQWGGRPVFYEIGPEMMPDLVELGLAFFKLGEQAYVDLGEFGLEGRSRSGLRYTFRKARKEGSSFAVVEPAGVPALMGELEAVSNAWLASKSAAEKSFSLGRFRRDYIAALPVATVRHGGRIVAFANLWPSADRHELSVDLMRYGPDAPRDVMEHLFIEIMLWGKAEGYRRFDLGMAPLAGLDSRKLAPLWARAAALLYRYGEDYYNFEGLRRYKNKFKPAWEARYLAVPGGLALPAVLADVTVLIGGGLGGVLGRKGRTSPALGIAMAHS